MQSGDRAAPTQLDRIEAKLDRLSGLLDTVATLESVAATAGDAIDDLADRMPGGSAGVDARLHRAMRLMERISRPSVLETLEQAVALAESVPDLVATAGDTFDDLVDRGRAIGIEPDALAAALVTSGMLRRGNVELLAKAVAEVGPAAVAPSRPVGVWSAAMTLREPEVQRALSFLLQFLRRFGAVLDDEEKG